jgi:cobalt-zinc-cadmium efflux system protein
MGSGGAAPGGVCELPATRRRLIATTEHHHDPHDAGHGAVVNARSERRAAQRRALQIALVANAAFLLVEVAGGVVFNSLALLADAAHMLSDVAALAVALIAQRLVDRPATVRHSYGLQRAEVLGAQINGMVLLVVSAWIIVEAVRRLGEPPEHIGGIGMLAVAAAGLVVNVACAVVLARAGGWHAGHRGHDHADGHHHERSLNMHGAFLHMTADAAGSVGALLAGLAIVLWGATWADPVTSLVIAALVVWSAWGLLRDTAHVLLEGTPAGVDPAAVEAALEADPDVEAVHHLHVWNLASDVPSLTAHIVLRPELTLHEAQQRGERLKHLLDERFGIGHATLELECHACESPTDADPDRVAAPPK